MFCIAQRCHMYGVCDVIKSVCDVVDRLSVMTPINGCDVTCIVYMWPDILDVISYIDTVMS